MEAYSPSFYDAYFTGVEGDVEFYVGQAHQSEGPVLELGCGTGRILLPLARASVQIVGLDLSGELLEVARRRLEEESPRIRGRATLVQGDMRDFSLGRKFGLVVVPYRAFQHLLTPVDQEEALGCIYDHLAEGGRLIFDTYDPLLDMIENGFRSPLRKDTDFVDPDTGNQVVVWYSRQYDPQMQLMEQELIYELIGSGGEVIGRKYGRLTLRYAFQYEMQYLLEQCGFEVEALYGDFQGGPFPGHGEQIWIARRAE